MLVDISVVLLFVDVGCDVGVVGWFFIRMVLFIIDFVVSFVLRSVVLIVLIVDMWFEIGLVIWFVMVLGLNMIDVLVCCLIVSSVLVRVCEGCEIE